MTEETNNLLWGPLANFREALARTETFQQLQADAGRIDESIIGTPEAITAVKPSIYIGVIPGPLAAINAARPLLLIDQGNQWSSSRVSSTGFNENGSVLLHIEASVPEEFQDDKSKTHAERCVLAENAHKWFCELAGNILIDLLTVTDAEGMIYIRGVGLDYGPERSDLDQKSSEGDHYQIRFEINWGVK